MIKKSIIIFIILSVIASGLNYIVYPLFARILGPSEYVNITVALSLFTQVSTFLSSIIAITIGLSKSQKDDALKNKKIELLQAALFKIFLVLALAFLILSPIIMNGLNTPVLFAIPIAIMMLLSIPIQVISGYLNGKNLMIKLGLVVLISASSQFTIGLIASISSHSGLITMLSMAIAQILTLIIIYFVFSKDNLPGIRKSLKISTIEIHKNNISPLIIYTLLTSVAIMFVSLVQIADLFIIKNLTNVDAKFYTDIYVVSRIVFFGGMIFIWPFLGEIDINNHRLNRKPFAKLIGYFTLIALFATVLMYFFGSQITNILFGESYNTELTRSVSILSILYKYALLIVTAVVLYFVVLRKYLAVWLSISISTVILLTSKIISNDTDIQSVLLILNAVAGISATVCVATLIKTRTNN